MFAVRWEIIFRRFRIVARSARWLHHVRPSASLYQRSSHWTDFREIWYWRGVLLRKSIEELRVSLKSGGALYTKAQVCFIVVTGDINLL